MGTGGLRIYVIAFSRTVSIVRVMLNEGPEGQQPNYLRAIEAARPEFQYQPHQTNSTFMENLNLNVSKLSGIFQVSGLYLAISIITLNSFHNF